MLQLPSFTMKSQPNGSANPTVETYVIDPVHSSVNFTIRHFVSKVTGRFTKFEGTIAVDRGNLENSSITAAIDTGSLSTADEKRDEHLRSADFFDASEFATMTFQSKSWKKSGEDTYDVAGNLTLRGISKPVVLKVALLGFGPGMQGALLSGWEATTTINRTDFGLNGPAFLGTMLGNEVQISLAIEASLKK